MLAIPRIKMVKMETVRYVTYKRISYNDQGQQDLSLAMQERCIHYFLESCSETGHVIVAQFTDDQTSGDLDWTELDKALSLCRLERATLLIAQLDRLPLPEVGTHPILSDPDLLISVAVLPLASMADLAVYARLLAQQRAFCARQAAAVLQKRARQGTYRRTIANEKLFAEDEPQSAVENVIAIITSMRKRGATMRDIAGALNRTGIMTSRGTAWRPSQVSRLLHLICS